MTLELTSLAIVIVCAIALHKRFGLTSWQNPMILFWWYHVVFLWIGLFYGELYSAYVEITPQVYYLIWTGMSSCVAGAFIASAYFGTGPDSIAIPQKLKCFDNVQIRRGLALFVIGTGFAATLLYYGLAGSIPFLAEDADNFRIEARMGRGWLVIAALALLRYGVIHYAAVSGAARTNMFRALTVILLAAAAAIGMGDRAPGLEICVFGLLTYLLFSGKTPSFKRLTTYAVIGLAVTAILGIVRQGLEMNLLMVGLQMAWRPFVNVQNMQWICDYFPSGHDFLMGKGYWIDLKVLLPGYSPNFGTWFKEQSGLAFSGGSVTVSYLGEIFANFGTWGVPIIASLYGFILTSLNSLLLRHSGGDRLLLLILLATSLKAIISSGVVSVLLYDTMPILAVHVLFLGVAKFFSAVSKTRQASAASNV